MSWIRDHFYQFVFPALEMRMNGMKPTESDVKEFFEKNGSCWPKVPQDYPWRCKEYFHSKRDMPSELRALKYWCDQTPDTQFNSSNYAGDPLNEGVARSEYYWNLQKNSLISANAIRKQLGVERLLLTGRDMWFTEVMARKLNIPTLFVREVSRNVVNMGENGGNAQCRAVKKFFKDLGLGKDELLYDTGFSGTIPLTMQRFLNLDIRFVLMSQDTSSSTLPGVIPIFSYPTENRWKDTEHDPNKRPNEIFPNKKRCRDDVLKIEGLPKYFTSGDVRYINGKYKVCQYVRYHQDIISTAILTSMVYRGIKGPGDMAKSEHRRSIKRRKKRVKKHHYTHSTLYHVNVPEKALECGCEYCSQQIKMFTKWSNKKKWRKILRKKRIAKVAKAA
jgi:hypothetical protein